MPKDPTIIPLSPLPPVEEMDISVDQIQFGRSADSMRTSQLRGPVLKTIRITGGFTLGSNEEVVIADTNQAAFDLLLPRDPSGRRPVWIKNIGSNTLTVKGQEKEIEGSSADYLILANECFLFYFFNDEWRILALFL